MTSSAMNVVPQFLQKNVVLQRLLEKQAALAAAGDVHAAMAQRDAYTLSLQAMDLMAYHNKDSTSGPHIQCPLRILMNHHMDDDEGCGPVPFTTQSFEQVMYDSTVRLEEPLGSTVVVAPLRSIMMRGVAAPCVREGVSCSLPPLETA